MLASAAARGVASTCSQTLLTRRSHLTTTRESCSLMDAFAPSPRLAHRPVSSQRVFTESSTGFERGSLSPMYLGRPEGLQLGRKDVAETGIRTEIQTGIHQHARSQNVPMITMQWFVVVCAPPAPMAGAERQTRQKWTRLGGNGLAQLAFST
jgi:hypothetical protein